MEVSGEYTFDAPQLLVWQALQDPEVLGSVMPGGEGFEEIGENEYAGNLKIKVGPVQGKFSGNIKLADIEPPESYTMTVDGKGAPGFVKASGRMQLTGQSNSTHMVYEGSAQVGGRIASVGQRLLDASAKSIIRQSLEGLNEYLKAKAVGQMNTVEGATSEDETSMMARPESVPAYRPPSQTAVAVNVAKDVAGDLVPAKYRPLVIGIAAVLIIAVLYLILS